MPCVPLATAFEQQLPAIIAMIATQPHTRIKPDGPQASFGQLQNIATCSARQAGFVRAVPRLELQIAAKPH